MRDVDLDDTAETPPATGSPQPDKAWLVLSSEVVLGTIFSGIVVFALVMVAVGAVGMGYGAGAVLGGFCAMWGGPGFGVMAACAMNAGRTERADAAASHPSPQGTHHG